MCHYVHTTRMYTFYNRHWNAKQIFSNILHMTDLYRACPILSFVTAECWSSKPAMQRTLFSVCNEVGSLSEMINTSTEEHILKK